VSEFKVLFSDLHCPSVVSVTYIALLFFSVDYISLLRRCVLHCIKAESQRSGLNNSGDDEVEGNGEEQDQSQVCLLINYWGPSWS
jgi:hypothetical protein